MRIFAALVILLSASSTMFAFPWIFSRGLKTNDRLLIEFIEFNARSVEAFNRYLGVKETSSELERNKKVAKTYNTMDESLVSFSEQVRARAGQIAKLVTNLNYDNDCTAEKIASTWKTVTELVSYEPKMLHKNADRRLSALVRDFIKRLTENCLLKLDKEWSTIEHDFDEISNSIEDHIKSLLSYPSAREAAYMDVTRMLAALDYFMNFRETIVGRKLDQALLDIDKSKLLKTIEALKASTSSKQSKSGDTKTLDSHIIQILDNKYFDITGSFKGEEMTKKELAKYKKIIKAMIGDSLAELMSIKKGKKSGAKNQETSKPTLSFSDVMVFVEGNYYTPCKQLVEQDKSKSILKSVGELASLANLVDQVNLAEHMTKHNERDNIPIFLWTSRYYYCRWQLLQDKEQFAERVYKITN